MNAQLDLQLRRELAGEIDGLRRDAMREIHGRTIESTAASQAAIAQFINQIGGEITNTASVDARWRDLLL
jgi:hypothetical protein